MNTTDQMTERACQHCGGTMEGKRPQAIHCGERCRDQARRQRERQARQAHPRPRKPQPTSRPASRKHIPGNAYGSLTLVERIEGSGEPRALFRCECGNVKALQINNVARGITTNCADRANHVDPRRQELLTYDGAHARVKNERGSASLYLCRCGNQADQWAYSHADYDERADIKGREARKPYSTNPDKYVPMCRPCHTRFDNAHRRTIGDGLSLVHVAYWAATHDQAEQVAA
ncbi:hypothetical protein ACIBPB_19940 [Micromonospora sp. NPDC049836]|uniref:hypothetical protein n=1 Tax=Micromonospora sp. NPDC049836 TaxID=3364274 RepID=UPI0037A4398F